MEKAMNSESEYKHDVPIKMHKLSVFNSFLISTRKLYIKRRCFVGVNSIPYKNRIRQEAKERNESILRMHKILALCKQIANNSWSFPIIYMWTIREIEMTQTHSHQRTGQVCLSSGQAHTKTHEETHARTLDEFYSMHITNDTLICAAYDLMPCNKCTHKQMLQHWYLFAMISTCQRSIFRVEGKIWNSDPRNKLKIKRTRWNGAAGGGGRRVNML